MHAVFVVVDPMRRPAALAVDVEYPTQNRPKHLLAWKRLYLLGGVGCH